MIALLLVLQDVPDLIDRLGHPDIEVREAAQEDLLRLRPLEALEARRDDADEERRARVRVLLRKLDSSFALVEDLYSDETPGNAARARGILFRRLTSEREKTLPVLLEAVRSSDAQAVFFASYLLLYSDESEELLRARPDLPEWAIGELCAGGLGDYRWLAFRVILRFWRERPREVIEKAFEKGLRGRKSRVALRLHETIASALLDLVPGRRPTPISILLSESRLFYPAAITRRLALNLCADTERANAFYAEWYLSSLGEFAHDALLVSLDDLDDQGLSRVIPILARGMESPLPEPLLRAMAEHPLAVGPPMEDLPRWLPHLLKAVTRKTDPENMDRIRWIARIDPAAERAVLLPLAVKALASDNHDGNACRAAEALALWGDAAPLLPLLESDDAQVVVAACVVLGRIGRVPAKIPANVARRISELFSQGGDADDEWKCALEALRYVPDAFADSPRFHASKRWRLEEATDGWRWIEP